MNPRRSFFILSVTVCLIGLYLILSAILDANKTGALKINVSDPGAIVSVAGEYKRSEVIGKGSTGVRLMPGTYNIEVSGGGNHLAEIVSVRAKQTSRVNFDLKNNGNNNLPATVDRVDFENTDELVSSGLSTDQLNALEQYFFQYKSSARKITIVSGSVSPAPHNPATDTSFTINFKVTIDGTLYAASVNYPDSENIRLYLTDVNAKALLFDSGAAANQPQDGE